MIKVKIYILYIEILYKINRINFSTILQSFLHTLECHINAMLYEYGSNPETWNASNYPNTDIHSMIILSNCKRTVGNEEQMRKITISK